MENFIRARNNEQKEFRINEIKTAADSVFGENPYSEITLTTVAQKLGWSRANLYKYFSTKEEIYLALTEDKMQKYFSSLNAAFPKNNKFSSQVIAEVWAGILNVNQDYLRYVSILSSIIEKNVSVERLADFKKKYYDLTSDFCKKFSETLKISQNSAQKIFYDVLLFSSANSSTCEKNPLVQSALKMIDVKLEPFDFYENLKNFILMEINWQICDKANA